MELANITEIRKNIPNNVKIVAATKYVNSSDMRKLYAAGIHDFGENRVVDFLRKKEELKDLPITWHFIGHLQRNKAKSILQHISYLHSLDSLELAKIIQKERQTPLKCFIEVNMNHEETKSGINYRDIPSFMEEIKKYSKVEVIGLMGMTIKNSSIEEQYKQFKFLFDLKEQINHDYHLELKELSMGMSDDYIEAIKAGSTMVRLGRILWTQEK